MNAGNTLSQREARVLWFIGQGETNKRAAALMGISEGYVENICARLFAKLGVGNRVDAAKVAWDEPARASVPDAS